jgi:ribonuclease E
VAEVTSLGLVQMTRKKLGLGLLETFSEPCEVCAGRGVVVHHDPVTKHRQTQQPPIERRRGKGGQGGGNSGNGGSSSSSPAVAPHAITDDAKNALAQIAASTLAAHAAGEAAAAGATPAVAAEVAATVVAEIGETREESHDDVASGSRGRGRRSRSGSQREKKTDARASRSAEQDRTADEHGDSAENASKEAAPESVPGSELDAVAILDIPITVPARAKQRVPNREAEHLLDSVLEALPAPKQPGQGRNRNRRVTTAALSGGVIAAEPRSGEHAE